MPQTMGVDLKCQRMKSENVGRCQIPESTPPVRLGRAELYAGTMRLNHIRGQNFTCFQNNVIENFKAMGDETLNQELPPTHTYKHTYAYTHRPKKVIYVYIYLNEIAIVLVMFIIV